MIGTWKWKPADFEVPLTFQLPGVLAHLFLEAFDAGKRERSIVWDALLRFEFSTPTRQLLQSLHTSGKLARGLADALYGHYITIYEQLEAVLRTTGGVVSLMRESPMSFEEVFAADQFLGPRVTWWREGEAPKPFQVRLSPGRRRVRPLFKGGQILTTRKWQRLQTAINDGDFPAPEVLELLRLRAQLEWRQKKVATIEAAILVESLLRDYTQKVLEGAGLSKNRIKALRDELTFNAFLNIVLPLSVSKAQAQRLEGHIRRVDSLRRIRNDLVHGNISEADVDEAIVRSGIEGALHLADFVKRRVSGP